MREPFAPGYEAYERVIAKTLPDATREQIQRRLLMVDGEGLAADIERDIYAEILVRRWPEAYATHH